MKAVETQRWGDVWRLDGQETTGGSACVGTAQMVWTGVMEWPWLQAVYEPCSHLLLALCEYTHPHTHVHTHSLAFTHTHRFTLIVGARMGYVYCYYL